VPHRARQLTEHRIRLPGRRTAPGAGQRRVGRKYLLVQVPQLGSWFGAQLGHEDPAGLLIGGDRLALAAAPVEGEHQQRVQVLAQRVRAGEAL